MNSRIIFHLPWKLRNDLLSASQIRPRKMLDAFISLGYQVDVVMGSVTERKTQISQINNNITAGVKYDFCYSESSVGPTLITNGYKEYMKHGSPDLKFLKNLRKNNIKVGMFYRDIYWKLGGYLKRNSFLKATIFRHLYKHDLRCYRKSLDVMFLPSATMGSYLGNTPYKKHPLPSGCNPGSFPRKAKSANIVSLMYVGGIGSHYNLDLLINAMGDYKGKAELLLCVRENEWQSFISNRKEEVSENVKVYHKSGEGLKEVYQMADIASLYMAPEEFRNFAMPFKLFEYIEQQLPILASTDTEAGRYIEQNKLGWTIEYSESGFKGWLDQLLKSSDQIAKAVYVLKDFKTANTWEERAKEAAQSLQN